jgi:ribose transport system substrate-binding protein
VGGAGEWYNGLTDGAQAVFEELGIAVVATSDAQFDPAKQATDVETALALQPDIILTLPVDLFQQPRLSSPLLTREWRLFSRTMESMATLLATSISES